MPKIIVKINILDKEKAVVIALMTRLIPISKSLSVQHMADMLSTNVNRLRYTIDELQEESVIEKIPVGIHKENYKRYTYKVLDKIKYKDV